MDRDIATALFYIFGAIGTIITGFGIGFITTTGIGFLFAGLGLITLIPGGIWFSNNIEKFLKVDKEKLDE